MFSEPRRAMYASICCIRFNSTAACGVNCSSLAVSISSRVTLAR